MESPTPNVILLVEDNPIDVFLFERACSKIKVSFIYHAVPDGGRAIAYLSGVGKYADRLLYPLPNLIVLDIKLPDISGFDVLRWIRSEPDVKYLPVIMFTTSSFETDVAKAYENQVNGYIVKPVDSTLFTEIIQSLENFWLRKNVTPKTVPSP
ncbi:MAG: response regulator [Rariglobus sp.]